MARGSAPLLSNILTIILLASAFIYASAYTVQFEVDAVATVYRIVDGDTFDADPVGRVRLADVNAPELTEAGGKDSKEALASLILGKRVYLDVDDKHVRDRYNRLVCVVYVRVNSSTLLNINRWLWERGYVKVADYSNEFNPHAWSLYVTYPEELENASTDTPTRTAIVSGSTILSTSPIPRGENPKPSGPDWALILAPTVILLSALFVVLALSPYLRRPGSPRRSRR